MRSDTMNSPDTEYGNVQLHFLKTNQDAHLQTERRRCPDRNGMGVRERSFSRSWVEPKERASACPAIRVHVPLPPPPTIYSVSGPRPPLDSKELQLHNTNSHSHRRHANSENGKQARGSGRARRKEERGERAGLKSKWDT
jgi:hypothetical protein